MADKSQASHIKEGFAPPSPKRLPPMAALARTIMQGDGDLLSLLPADAYKMDAGELGYSRRSIKIFNDADLVSEIMQDKDEIFPKSDLMVGALEPLIGNSVFVSDGAVWRRQRAMIDAAFSLMRLNLAFASMRSAVDEHEKRLLRAADTGDVISLDLAMSHLTADIICRTVFSVPLQSKTAKDVFDDFTVFERGVAQVKIWRLITDRAFAKPRQDPEVMRACKRIRRHLGELVDTHLSDGMGRFNDIASAVIAARDRDTGEGFTREELIDQLGVFFLAGHETTASVLTWVFYILALRPEILALVRAEVDQVVGDGEVTLEHVKKLPYIKSVFKETLRLYPPITFMPRVAMRSGQIGKYKVRRGALIMIAPWTIHRRAEYWPRPDVFDPQRFSVSREKDIPSGAYIPFGLGPHICVGAGFAVMESALIIARLARRFDLSFEGNVKAVRPVARLTTRPASQVMIRVRLHKS
ncbi:MAG: cytochrome P450 [Pseudomonadota bacterium]